MENIVRDLNILWRAEAIVADIRFREVMKRSEFRVFAALSATFALAMINVAGFFGFEQWWGAVWASVAMGAVDLALAAVLLALAAAVKPARDLELARDVRQAALESLEVHVKSVRHDISALRDDICRVRGALTGHNALDTILPALVVPLTRILLKALRKSEPDPTLPR